MLHKSTPVLRDRDSVRFQGHFAGLGIKPSASSLAPDAQRSPLALLLCMGPGCMFACYYQSALMSVSAAVTQLPFETWSRNRVTLVPKILRNPLGG